MMEYIFSRIFIMSLAGTVSLFLILPVLFINHRFSAKLRYYSLVAAMLVFLIPLSVKVPDTIAETQKSEIVTSIKEDGYTPTITYKDGRIITSEPISENSNKLKKDFSLFTNVIGYIWVIGTALIFTYYFFSYSVFKYRLWKNSYPAPIITECINSSRVRTSNVISSPMLIGLFKPTLYFPDKELTQVDIENILRHECIHIKRFDLPVKWICVIAKSLHWFNPAVYILTRKIADECEISCDIEATKSLDRESSARYCETILSLISDSKKCISPALGMGDTKKNLERRFRAIMKKKPVKRKVVVISVIAAGVIIISALTASAVFGGRIERKEKNADIGYETVVVYREPENNEDIATLRVEKAVDDEDCAEKENRIFPSEDEKTPSIRVHPITGEKAANNEIEISQGFDKDNHPAVDYKLEEGTVITSPVDGTILAAEYNPDKGNQIEIECLDGTTKIIFAHLEKMFVAEGDRVTAGDTVGTVGTTGKSTGPHLHVEYYKDGKALNPVEVFIEEENGEILAIYSHPEYKPD